MHRFEKKKKGEEGAYLSFKQIPPWKSGRLADYFCHRSKKNAIFITLSQ